MGLAGRVGLSRGGVGGRGNFPIHGQYPWPPSPPWSFIPCPLPWHIPWSPCTPNTHLGHATHVLYGGPLLRELREDSLDTVKDSVHV